MGFQLIDEGTLDTSLKCEECGIVLRYNFDEVGGDMLASDYDYFVDWCIADAESHHKHGLNYSEVEL